MSGNLGADKARMSGSGRLWWLVAIALLVCLLGGGRLRAQALSNIASLGPDYDSSYFRHQDSLIHAMVDCEDGETWPELQGVFDHTDTLKVAKIGCLQKYARRAAKDLPAQSGGHVSDADLDWLQIMDTRTLKAIARGYPRIYRPGCRTLITPMLPFSDLNTLLQGLAQARPEDIASQPLAESVVLNLNGRALSGNYASAQEIYVGTWSEVVTPSGPGIALTAWHLEKIDPNHRWRLDRVDLVLHYEQGGGSLDRATIYIRPIAGDYRGHFESLSTLSWDGKACRVMAIQAQDDVEGGGPPFRQIRIYEGGE